MIQEIRKKARSKTGKKVRSMIQEINVRSKIRKLVYKVIFCKTFA
jgi:hypothetical protein